MAGTIGLIATDLARYTAFTKCILQVRAPVNTDIRFGIGTDFAHNRNRIVVEALDRGTEWVWFIDDDMLFAPEHLMRLLSHEKPIVASLYSTRQSPFEVLAYDHYEEGKGYTAVNLLEHPTQDGLIPILAAGSGGMLIRAEVFHGLPYPWFEKTEHGSEDMVFCLRAREAEHEIFLDLGAVCGHLMTSSIFPVFVDGGWVRQVTLSDGSSIFIDPNEPLG